MTIFQHPTRRRVAAFLALVPVLGTGTSALAARPEKIGPKRGRSKDARPAAAPAKPPVITAEDQQAAIIPGMPGVRFFGDEAAPFLEATRGTGGPWLSLSGGGSDGAYGAGLLVGLSAAGQRPEYRVVTGVSAGALMSPYVFLGPSMDSHLRDIYLGISSADVFEVAATPDSLFNTWPLERLIEKHATPDILEALAAEHAKGRRLFAVTTNLDAGRATVWNIGAIATYGGERALTLFRQILLASSSIPGFFPPVRIPVEANGKAFTETHADGTIRAPFYVTPEAVLAGENGARVGADPLFVILNSSPSVDYEQTPPTLAGVLGRSISATLKSAMRFEVFRVHAAAQQQGFKFQLARVPADFDVPSRGLFDPRYMKALFERGFEQARAGNAFTQEPLGHNESGGGAITSEADPAQTGSTAKAP